MSVPVLGCEQTQSLRQMRFVNHFAVELNSACATCLRKRIDDLLCVLQFFVRGGKARVDDGNLIGVYGQLTAEALASSALHIGF
jgi:hypothetical protein